MFGSSPRMWGTRVLKESSPSDDRFIPTHVGNTDGMTATPPSSSVHPHACGEHTGVCEGTPGLLGSSPRMWGTPGSATPLPGRRRFIPTHVGNTTSIGTAPSREAVHPHACGEHWIIAYLSNTLIGSSPRMWGTLIFIALIWLLSRFIPTHVGNTKI